MTTFHKVTKYIATGFAILLAVAIIGGIFGAVGLFCGFFSEGDITEDMTVYSVASHINNLNIEINAANLYIKKGEAFSVESNLKELSVEEKGDVLTVRETKSFTEIMKERL